MSAGARQAEIGRRLDQLQPLAHIGLRHAALLHPAREGPANGGQAALQRLNGLFDQHHGQAGAGHACGDAAPHRSGPDHADARDRPPANAGWNVVDDRGSPFTFCDVVRAGSLDGHPVRSWFRDQGRISVADRICLFAGTA
jgi:hypothetical protein